MAAERQQGRGKDGSLSAWAICADKRKVMLQLALGNRETYPNWLEFLRGMVKRGLRTPVQVTTDGAPGLIARGRGGLSQMSAATVLVP